MRWVAATRGGKMYINMGFAARSFHAVSSYSFNSCKLVLNLKSM